MRSRISRHLGPVLEAQPQRLGLVAGAVEAEAEVPPPEFGGREYARFLLHVAAGIEHSLMVQYLFAAYSLGGRDVPERLQREVRAWQETILGIAKEEMGHLVTVQNLLTALGAPLNFDREDYPYETPFYPFDFKLEAAEPRSLAAYVCAESPEDWDVEEAKRIRAVAQGDTRKDINRVGKLYADLIELLSDEQLIPDHAFDRRSVEFQASWDEWGRGYGEGQRGGELTDDLGLPAPELLILRVGSRQDAIAALREVGEQGEGSELPASDEDQSHFVRFRAIYYGLEELGDEAVKVVRPVVTNPTTEPPPEDAEQEQDPADPTTRTTIRDPVAKRWAHLFNLRYRMLLMNISHAFELADDPSDATALGPRGALIHRSFAEMYNLRSIAGLLVVLPADPADPDERRAGPPFQMPYTLKLPRDESDRWQLHLDLLEASGRLIAELRPDASADGRDYLAALDQADGLERDHLDLLISGSVRAAPVNGGSPP